MIKKNLYYSVYVLVARIPRGKVTTYGALAKKAGLKSPRLVGTILHQNPDPKTIPCHRVVNGGGKVAKNYAFGGLNAQRKKLLQEGVEIIKGGG